MKAMILAAGEGRRMRPLTLTTPKPLLRVGDRSLLEHHLIALRKAGIVDVVINIAYLGEKIEAALGDGSSLGVCIHYSREPEPLETGGALYRALPLLGEEPFVLINGDVWCDVDFSWLASLPVNTAGATLLLVPNPDHHVGGDFAFKQQGPQLQWPAKRPGDDTHTYAGIALMTPALIHRYPEARQKFPLREVFDWAISEQTLTGRIYSGDWCDVGTPERLEQLHRQITSAEP